ncbi:MAG TPA: glycine--tRNA ligase subunit beta [Burkholderiales bacterium]|nr:glycine--tRNA ligase subunit beta [Burkholderiales bacterium]
MRKRKPAAAAAPATLLVEVRTEELPPRALKRLSQSFAEALSADLRQDEFLTAASAVTAYATPRRLAVQITNVLARAPDKSVEVSGPSVKVGLDAEGKPTPALLGFARKQGVDPAKLERQQTPKGEVFVYRTLASGGHLETNLDLKVGFTLDKLPIPKVMRWGMGDSKFVRPVHGLVIMHGKRTIQGKVMDVESSSRTLGHRALARRSIRLGHADDYEAALRKQGHVLAAFAERRAAIVEQLAKRAGGAALVAGDALLDEITSLVEAPAVHTGKFDAQFLEVPQECLILSMQQHQRYVPLRDKATGELLPRFLFVSNLPVKNARAIVHGNERVLRARLADAKFFYDQDRKTRLENRVQRLSNVVYHGKLGSQLERVERMRLLANQIARRLGADFMLAEQAAWLSKADLLTEMVGEFPELQGIMGRYYALHDGETEEVADAIADHYRPRYAGDVLPVGNVGIAVALADKLYTLAGLFGIGQVPTGDRDPFGLRRAALGVIRILIERDLPLSLHDLIQEAFAVYDGKIGDAHADLGIFIRDRLAGYLRDRGYSVLEVESVLAAGSDRVSDTVRQLEAVRAFNVLPEAQSLAAANKRVVNILKQAEAKGETFANVGLDELKEPAERALFEALMDVSRLAGPLLAQGDFTGYLKSFAVLKSPVDTFFDAIMVMVEDPDVRKSRLALLADLRKQMNRIADISKLAA